MCLLQVTKIFLDHYGTADTKCDFEKSFENLQEFFQCQPFERIFDLTCELFGNDLRFVRSMHQRLLQFLKIDKFTTTDLIKYACSVLDIPAERALTLETEYSSIQNDLSKINKDENSDGQHENSDGQGKNSSGQNQMAESFFDCLYSAEDDMLNDGIIHKHSSLFGIEEASTSFKALQIQDWVEKINNQAAGLNDFIKKISNTYAAVLDIRKLLDGCRKEDPVSYTHLTLPTKRIV